MKKKCFSSFCGSFGIQYRTAITKTVGATGADYVTLKDAF